MKLAIIILHFGNIEDSLGCIESIKKSDFPKERLKIILVNNDLNLISGSRIKSGMTQIQIINNSKNLGFAKGMNVGIKEALSDKDVSDILLLNNDTVLEKNTLSKLMDRKEEIVSPIMVIFGSTITEGRSTGLLAVLFMLNLQRITNTLQPESIMFPDAL